MSEGDPHIHVEVDVIHADAAVRNTLASLFGLAADLPSVVTTGCGLEVPYAMTSPEPTSVTCLACREHAHRRHLRYAEDVERLGWLPGSTFSDAQASQAADKHRELAKRFAAR